MKVTLGKGNDNPFYGLRANLELFSISNKGTVTHDLLDKCWNEIKKDVEKKKMFYSLLFSIGDITTRQHNIFGGMKVDSGGNAMRENFRTIMQWLKKEHKAQFYKFMYAHLFNEYTTFDNLLASRVKTKKKTSKVIEVIDMLGSYVEIQELASYIASIITSGSSFDKYLVAKYLTRPRLSKRQNHKRMLPETRKLMMKRNKLLKIISDKCEFPYDEYENYINFKGYYSWRRSHIENMESVIFSSTAISKFDREEFVTWLDKIPATARLRVRNRVLDKKEPKKRWGDLGLWFLEWEEFKKDAQRKQRVLKEKVRQGDTSEDTARELKEATKKAKVTVGANDFTSLFGDIITGKADEVKIQPFLDKIELPYNTLVFVDDSGSMSAHRHPKYGFSAFEFAAFMATIALMKNPSDVGRSIMGLFSKTTRMVNHISAVSNAPNSLMKGHTKHVRLPLYTPELSFTDNLTNMRGMLRANSQPFMTHISTIPDALNSWSRDDIVKIEMLQEFPVWTIITDGNFNSLPTPEASMNDFMVRCQRYFGYKPYVVAIDVSYNINTVNTEKFSGIENFIYVPPNPAQVEQLLTNFKDFDVMDVYTPLLSLYRSNRYQPVRDYVL